MTSPTREAQVRADRERIYVVIAYGRPPDSLALKPAKSGKVWFRRATGFFAADIAAELVKCGIPGRIKPTGRFLAGTPNWTPYNKRADSDDQEETDPRRMGPVQFAQRYKNATPLWRAAAHGKDAVQNLRTGKSRLPTKSRKRRNPKSRGHQPVVML